ncbi:MAG: stage II sporulation protein P [Bacillota bacterium]|nr:stage II sporulation protein P [Bacillota bacterium]
MKRIRNSFAILCAIIITIMAVVCTGIRLPISLGISANTPLLYVAKLELPNGSVEYSNITYSEKTSNVSKTSVSTVKKADDNQNNSHDTESPESAKAHAGEKKYSIIETQYGGSGAQYQNIFVKNSTGYGLNIGQELSYPLGFSMQNTSAPQVLIYHTHACEAYMKNDFGYYYSSSYSRSTNDDENVTQVGDEIAKVLNAAGIGTLHNTTHHDYPSYNGAYGRSEDTVRSYLKEYPSLKVEIDIHRDAIETSDNQKIKPTFIYNGQKAAQIMITTGYDGDGTLGFPNWEKNLRFALQIQKTAETMYPGMTRPMDFGNFCYNEEVNTGSVLIEVGTDANTIAEAKLSGDLLGNVLAKALKAQ